MALAYGKKCNWFAGRRRLVAQPGGLTLGFAIRLINCKLQTVIYLFIHSLRHCTQATTDILRSAYFILLGLVLDYGYVREADLRGGQMS